MRGSSGTSPWRRPRGASWKLTSSPPCPSCPGRRRRWARSIWTWRGWICPRGEPAGMSCRMRGAAPRAGEPPDPPSPHHAWGSGKGDGGGVEPPQLLLLHPLPPPPLTKDAPGGAPPVPPQTVMDIVPFAH